MKNLIILFILFPICVFSQNSSIDKITKALEEGDAKETSNSNQRYNDRKNSKENNYNLVNNLADAFDHHIYLVTHYYALEKGKKQYGADGENYFGLDNGIAFAIDNTLVVPKRITSPWESDEYYQEHSKDYKAVSYELVLEPIFTNNEVSNLSYDDFSSNRLDNSEIGYFELRKGFVNSLQKASTSKKDGVLILYKWNENKTTLSKEVVFCSPIWDENDNGRVKVLDDHSFDAGLYAIYEFGENANITFKPVGMLVGDKIQVFQKDLIPKEIAEDKTQAKQNKAAEKKGSKKPTRIKN